MGQLYQSQIRLGIRCCSSVDVAGIARVITAMPSAPLSWSGPTDGLYTAATFEPTELSTGVIGLVQAADGGGCIARRGQAWHRVLWPMQVIGGPGVPLAEVRAIVVRGPAVYSVPGERWLGTDPAFGLRAELGFLSGPAHLSRHCGAAIRADVGWSVWLSAPGFWPAWLAQEAAAAGITRARPGDKVAGIWDGTPIRGSSGR
jgi:hypothetical protein